MTILNFSTFFRPIFPIFLDFLRKVELFYLEFSFLEFAIFRKFLDFSRKWQPCLMFSYNFPTFSKITHNFSKLSIKFPDSPVKWQQKTV